MFRLPEHHFPNLCTCSQAPNGGEVVGLATVFAMEYTEPKVNFILASLLSKEFKAQCPVLQVP